MPVHQALGLKPNSFDLSSVASRAWSRFGNRSKRFLLHFVSSFQCSKLGMKPELQGRKGVILAISMLHQVYANQSPPGPAEVGGTQ